MTFYSTDRKPKEDTRHEILNVPAKMKCTRTSLSGLKRNCKENQGGVLSMKEKVEKTINKTNGALSIEEECKRAARFHENAGSIRICKRGCRTYA